MTVVVVECGPIDPNVSNLILLSKPIIHQCISSIQCVLWDCWCRGPETWHLVGVGALLVRPSLAHGQL
jgi:hypothetical protein